MPRILRKPGAESDRAASSHLSHVLAHFFCTFPFLHLCTFFLQYSLPSLSTQVGGLGAGGEAPLSSRSQTPHVLAHFSCMKEALHKSEFLEQNFSPSRSLHGADSMGGKVQTLHVFSQFRFVLFFEHLFFLQ